MHPERCVCAILHRCRRGMTAAWGPVCSEWQLGEQQEAHNSPAATYSSATATGLRQTCRSSPVEGITLVNVDGENTGCQRGVTLQAAELEGHTKAVVSHALGQWLAGVSGRGRREQQGEPARASFSHRVLRAKATMGDMAYKFTDVEGRRLVTPPRSRKIHQASPCARAQRFPPSALYLLPSGDGYFGQLHEVVGFP